MKLTRTDLGALAIVAVAGTVGVALFGPHMWGDDSVTVDVTTDVTSEWTSESAVSVDGEAVVIIKKKKVIRGDGTEEIIVSVEGEGDEMHERHIRVHADGDGEVLVERLGEEGEHFEWRSERGSDHATEERVRVRVREGEAVVTPGENVFMMRTTDGPEPLVYIDGERVERSAMDDLHPDRIDRVEVIKGEAAVELFGPEASAGVVQIFTKEGAGS